MEEQKRKWSTPLFTGTEMVRRRGMGQQLSTGFVSDVLYAGFGRCPLDDRHSGHISSYCLLNMLGRRDSVPCFTNEKAEQKKLSNLASRSRLPSKARTLNQCFRGRSFPSQPHVALALECLGSCQPSQAWGLGRPLRHTEHPAIGEADTMVCFP